MSRWNVSLLFFSSWNDHSIGRTSTNNPFLFPQIITFRMEDAFKFDESAKALCSEADYPYLATDDNTCNTNCTKVTGSIVADYLDIDEKDKHGLLASLALQPTSIAMQADQLSFQFYSSGVFSEESCGEEGAVDHGVLAVGYGTDSIKGDYVYIKNSWG